MTFTIPMFWLGVITVIVVEFAFSVTSTVLTTRKERREREEKLRKSFQKNSNND